MRPRSPTLHRFLVYPLQNVEVTAFRNFLHHFFVTVRHEGTAKSREPGRAEPERLGSDDSYTLLLLRSNISPCLGPGITLQPVTLDKAFEKSEGDRSDGHPSSSAHFNTSRCSDAAAAEHTRSSHGYPALRNH